MQLQAHTRFSIQRLPVSYTRHNRRGIWSEVQRERGSRDGQQGSWVNFECKVITVITVITRFSTKRFFLRWCSVVSVQRRVIVYVDLISINCVDLTN
jgi:hypothetical protein